MNVESEETSIKDKKKAEEAQEIKSKPNGILIQCCSNAVQVQAREGKA